MFITGADKAEFRKAVKEFYSTGFDRAESDRRLIQRFLTLPQTAMAKTILLFYGVGTEPDTRPILEELRARGKRVLLPCCLPNRQMEARLYSGSQSCQPDRYGIPTPNDRCPVCPRAEIDLVLVPDLLCDRRGYRLGHGAGYYDRYLEGYAGQTVALCRDALLQEWIPNDEYDIPVGLVLTETESLSFS